MMHRRMTHSTVAPPLQHFPHSIDDVSPSLSTQDLFSEFYRKKLSRRLLHDKSGSEEHERATLTHLKQQCGAQFTSKASAAEGEWDEFPCG